MIVTSVLAALYTMIAICNKRNKNESGFMATVSGVEVTYVGSQ